MNDKERILSGLSSLAEWLERNGFGDDCEGLRDTTALIERLAAENAALRAVADMVELRSLMGDVRDGSDDDDGGRQIVINMLSLRDEFISDASDERVAVRAVILQDGLSFIHRLVKQQTDIAEDKLRLLGTVAALRAEVERLTPREMTAQQACDVLNAMNHLYSSGWEITGDTLGSDDEPLVACQQTVFTASEAIWIAQGLERDAKGGG